MIDENTVRRIARSVRESFIIGSGNYDETPYYQRVYRTKFEAGLAWLYTFVLGKPIPKVVYCDNLGFLKRAKNKMDTVLNYGIVEERLHDRILVNLGERYSRYENLKQSHNFDSLIDEVFKIALNSNGEKLPFDIFNQVADMFYEIERSSFNLALFLREIMSFSVYDTISDCLGAEEFKYLMYPINLENVKNLCNSNVFHIFFGQDTVYALCYPYHYWYSKKFSILCFGYGTTSWSTFRPYFYWPYGPKIYASDETRVLPNWIFEEYMQEGYFKKLMDANDNEIRLGITHMIWKREGKKGLMDFLTSGFGDKKKAKHYYLQYIDSIEYIEKDE